MCSLHLAPSAEREKDKRHFEIIHIHYPVPFRSCCDYKIEQTTSPPPASEMSLCSWGRSEEDLYQRHQNDLQRIHAPHHPSSPSPPSSLPLRGTAGPEEPAAARPSAAESQTVREYRIIFPPLLWAVGEGINLVLVSGSRLSRRRCIAGLWGHRPRMFWS